MLVGDAKILHKHRYPVGTERFAVKLDIVQPVVLDSAVFGGIIDEVITLSIIMLKQLFSSEIIAACESEQLNTVRYKLINNVLELFFGIEPEHDAALVELLQRCIETLGKILLYIFNGTTGMKTSHLPHQNMECV